MWSAGILEHVQFLSHFHAAPGTGLEQYTFSDIAKLCYVTNCTTLMPNQPDNNPLPVSRASP